MARTSNLRRQHDAAVGLIVQIGNLAAQPMEVERAVTISLLMAKLTGLLRIHFAQEDRSLYPYMMSSSNELAAATAHAFHAEMGDLGPIYHAFADRWGSSKDIAADAAGFRREAEAVFKALARRIDRENNELYPLADTIRPDETSKVA